MSEKRWPPALRSAWYRRAAWAVRAALLLALVWELFTLDPVGVLCMALFIVLSFAYLLRDEKLPNVFDALVAISALLNAFGFVFGLFDGPALYDEVAHTLTIFSLTLAFSYLFYREAVPAARTLAMATAVFTFGVTAGSLWEIAEWTTGRVFGTTVVFGLSDAITDLIANSVGALGAAIVAVVTGRRERRTPRAHPDRRSGRQT